MHSVTMKHLAQHRSRLWGWAARQQHDHVLIATRRLSSSPEATELADRCNVNVVHSPYPPIVPGPYPPLYEFISSDWKPHGGYLKDQIAIIDGASGLERSFHDYYTTTTGVAGAFKLDFGIDEYSTVAMFCPNHVDYLPVTLAVTLCGAKITPINPLYTPRELEIILNRSRSSLLVAHATTLQTALQTANNCSHLKHIVVLTDHGEAIPEGTVDLNTLRHRKGALHESPTIVHRHVDSHPAILPYSSGTTGLPKAVCLTHRNIVANLMQVEEAESIAFAPGHKLISPLPFFHIYGFTVSMLYCAWKGHTLITSSGRFDLERFCQLVQEHKPQRAHLVPPILLGLAKNPVVDKYDMSSLQTVISGAAPLSSNTELAVTKRLKCEVKQTWGMSELSPLGTWNSDYSSKSGSIGPLVSSTVAKVVDENGKSLALREPGELMIKGPQVMLGYLDDPESTAECLSASGWLRTGDLAYYDEEGYFFICDRLKELIKVRGYPVAPAELEALLLSHEAVADAGVIQVPDDVSGELPRAYVVLKGTDAAKQVVEEELYLWVKDRVAAYKRLDGGVIFTDSIPKSASGKILRRILRDQDRQEGVVG